MSFPSQVQICRLVWAEYGAGNSLELAQININTKNDHHIPTWLIRFWYRRFKTDPICLFDEHIDKSCLTRATCKLNGNKEEMNNFILSVNRKYGENSHIIAVDGRLLISFDSDWIENAIFFYDLFRNSVKKVPLTDMINFGQISSMKLVQNNHLLIAIQGKLILLKIDHETSKVSILSIANHELKYPPIVMDKLDNQKFVLWDESILVTGSVLNDQIILGQPQIFDKLRWPKLAGNQLWGFRRSIGGYYAPVIRVSHFRQFYQFDLETSAEKITYVPSTPTIDEIDWFDNQSHCWAGNRLYTQIGSYFDCHIFAFDSDTLKWTDIKISVYAPIELLFVDKTNCLTIYTGRRHLRDFMTCYRVPLNPDSLKNITWTNIRRRAILFDKKLTRIFTIVALVRYFLMTIKQHSHVYNKK